MTIDKLLEVEDGEIVGLSDTEELTEGGIGLDGLLVHKVAAAGIVNDGLGNSRAADLSTLGEAEERAELITDLDRLGEDAVLDLAIGRGLSLATTLLVGLLDNTAGLLLNSLETVGESDETGLEGGDLLLEIGDGLEEGRVDILLNGSDRRSRGGNNGGGNGSDDILLGGLGLGFLHRGGNGGSDSGGDFSLGSLLGGLGSTHFGVIGGSN